MIEFRGLVSLGGLYRSGVATPRPTRPWIVDLSDFKPYDGIEPGNIADFSEAPEWGSWRLGDTPDEEENTLNWIALEEGERRILICDRVILVRVSWQDLCDEGFVAGASVRIDGDSYVCRLLTGGSDFRIADDGYSGGSPPDNEWDRYVAGGESIKSLPAPEPGDLDDVLSESDRLGGHNQIWNWMGVVSWTATPFARRESARCCRGYCSANYFYLNTYDHRHEDIGWRPVLEMSAPGSK